VARDGRSHPKLNAKYECQSGYLWPDRRFRFTSTCNCTRNRIGGEGSLQTALRELSDDDGFVEENLWTGIGRARSGCGAAIVGTPDQVLAKIKRYMDMGIRAFIFSGYPHLDECKLFGRYVLPQIKTFSMPEVQGRRLAKEPDSPLAGGKRN